MAALLFRSLLVAACLTALNHAAVPADEITTLPGWTGKLPSKTYSGFFPTTLDGSTGSMLHYWLTLSENSPATDPLVVWLQGGPGCSSLFGMMYENGQLHFSGEKDNSTGVPLLVQNPYAWTKVANMLWLEQPVGVGFSYCVANNCSCDYEGCAFDVDAYNFFVNFFAAYPELAKLDFHISGESYGGVYVPYIADAVLTGNAGGKNPAINLKGILIGNGLGGDADDSEMYRRDSDFFYGHAAFSYQQQRTIDQACDWNSTLSPNCLNAIEAAQNGVGNYYMSILAQTTTTAMHLSHLGDCCCSIAQLPMSASEYHSHCVLVLLSLCADTTSMTPALTICWQSKCLSCPRMSCSRQACSLLSTAVRSKTSASSVSGSRSAPTTSTCQPYRKPSTCLRRTLATGKYAAAATSPLQMGTPTVACSSNYTATSCNDAV